MIPTIPSLKVLAPSPTIAIMAVAQEMKKTGKHVYNFGVGEMVPEFTLPEVIKKEISYALDTNQTGYVSSQGDLDLRDAISKDFKNFDLNYGPQQICICSGPKDALFKVCMTLLSPLSKRNRVVCFAPFYEAFVNIPLMITGQSSYVLQTDENFQPNIDEFRKFLQEHHEEISIVIVNSPNNPSGAIYSDSTIKEMASIIKEYPQIAVLADDVYRTIYYCDSPPTPIASILPEQTIIVGGMSKELVGTGMRIGFAAGPEYLINAITNVQGSSLPIQKGYTAFLRQDTDLKIRKEICQRLKEKKDLVVKGFSQHKGLKDMIWKAPTGAFYFFPCVKNYLGKMAPSGKKIENDEDFAMYLIESVQVVVLPGSKFDRKDHIRMAFACISDSQLTEALEKMANALEKLQ